jgi:hypothetical protein
MHSVHIYGWRSGPYSFPVGGGRATLRLPQLGCHSRQCHGLVCVDRQLIGLEAGLGSSLVGLPDHGSFGHDHFGD